MKAMIPWKALAGFAWLFLCYHAAEYFVIFDFKPVAFLGIQGLFFLSAWLIARWQGFEGLGAWGLLFNKSALRNLLTGLFAGGIVYGLWFSSSLALKQEMIVQYPGWKEGLQTFLLFAFGTFFSSLSEDIFVRGYLYRHLGKAVSPNLLISLSSLVYLLNHIYRLGDGPLVWAYILIIGIFLMMALVRTGNIWLTLGLHWSGNIIYQATHQVIKTQTLVSGNQGLFLYIGFLLLLIPVTLMATQYLKKYSTSHR